MSWRDGRPIFEAIDPSKYERCVREDLCWLCGRPNTKRRAFVLGPMCTVNRVTAEPPCHVTCAEYACVVCPFLTKPLARRKPKPEDATDPAGEMIARNPGAVLLWVVHRDGYRFVQYPNGGVLVHLEGDPLDLRAYSRGLEGDWDAVETSMQSGMPILQDMCKGEDDTEALKVCYTDALKLVQRAAHGTL